MITCFENYSKTPGGGTGSTITGIQQTPATTAGPGGSQNPAGPSNPTAAATTAAPGGLGLASMQEFV